MGKQRIKHTIANLVAVPTAASVVVDSCVEANQTYARNGRTTGSFKSGRQEGWKCITSSNLS